MAKCPQCRAVFDEEAMGVDRCPDCGLGSHESPNFGDCECGEPATKTWDEGADYAFWTRQPRHTPVCDEYWTKRDNDEPPDPDGEAFRGGEAAAYQAEQLERARRLK